MPVLQITCIDNAQWVCQIANTGVSYPFIGASLDQQSLNVVAFANSMQANNPDYVINFLDDTGDLSAGELSQQIFGTTDQLMYIDKLIWGTIGEDAYLIDELSEAGTALLIALG